MNEMTPNQMRERLGNIDQIRDILFGDRSREYDRRFNQLESELTSLKQNLTADIESLRSVFIKDLRTAIDAFEKKLQYVNASLDEEANDLRNQIATLETRLSSNLTVAEKSLKVQVNGLQEEVTETRQRLDAETHALRAQILHELNQRSQQLESDKMSRADLAEILFDVCMQVKGNERQPARSAAPDSSPNGERLILPERQENHQPEPIADSGGEAIE